ncbi:MAG: UDP-N-acetylmuramate--L-alanine ligase [Spirochaetales bacterium]
MSAPGLLSSVERLNVYMVGIKGTGMAALAEILVARGATVTGSDVEETFHTDELLRNAGISFREGFAGSNLRDTTPRPDLVIHSAAYDPNDHPELLEARRLGVPIMLYTEALGRLSALCPSVGIAGVHGKTTTTALVAAIVQELGLPGTVLAGSALAGVGGRATLVQGNEFLVAETCEYRRHFLSFSPRAILVTSVEPDHLDYFKDGADVENAFVEYADRIAPGGSFVYCADDPGACRVAAAVESRRSDLALLPYGLSADGPGRVHIGARGAGAVDFTIGGSPYRLRVPGDHNALNAAGALLVSRLVAAWSGSGLSDSEFSVGAAPAIEGFRGTRRRAEFVGEAGGVIVLDDYAHHPTAIAKTLAGLRSFYPDRRIVLSFMSHTYSRTIALLGEFAQALAAADIVILHDIYASAREANPGDVDGEILAVATHRLNRNVHYVPGVLEALPLAERVVRSGDLFVTMGAGDNWRLGTRLLDRLRAEVAQ